MEDERVAEGDDAPRQRARVVRKRHLQGRAEQWARSGQVSACTPLSDSRHSVGGSSRRPHHAGAVPLRMQAGREAGRGKERQPSTSTACSRVAVRSNSLVLWFWYLGQQRAVWQQPQVQHQQQVCVVAEVEQVVVPPAGRWRGKRYKLSLQRPLQTRTQNACTAGRGGKERSALAWSCLTQSARC